MCMGIPCVRASTSALSCSRPAQLRTPPANDLSTILGIPPEKLVRRGVQMVDPNVFFLNLPLLQFEGLDVCTGT